MVTFADFLWRLGNLHDCEVVVIEWTVPEKRLKFIFKNISKNYEGYPEYQGPTPGHLILHGVKKITIDAEWPDKLPRIMDFLLDVSETEGGVSTVNFWPSGKIRVVFTYAEFPELPAVARGSE